MIKNRIMDKQHTWIVAYLIKVQIYYSIYFFTLGYQIRLRLDHREFVGYQSSSHHNSDENQMKYICNKLQTTCEAMDKLNCSKQHLSSCFKSKGI